MQHSRQQLPCNIFCGRLQSYCGRSRCARPIIRPIHRPRRQQPLDSSGLAPEWPHRRGGPDQLLLDRHDGLCQTIHVSRQPNTYKPRTWINTRFTKVRTKLTRTPTRHRHNQTEWLRKKNSRTTGSASPQSFSKCSSSKCREGMQRIRRACRRRRRPRASQRGIASAGACKTKTQPDRSTCTARCDTFC